MPVMRWRAVCRLARQLPEVQEGRVYGARALRVRGSIVARLGDDKRSVLVKVDPARRAELCAARPETFSVAPGSQNYPMVAVTLATVSPSELGELLAGSWRRSAPPSLVAAYDASSSKT